MLSCPVCGVDAADAALRVTADDRSLGCAAAHRFDIARQGYVSLSDGRSVTHRSDTAPMVAARSRVHDSGVFDAVADAVAEQVDDHLGGDDVPGVVLDAGAGTGYYLARVLDRCDHLRGVGLDLSKYCARAVARSHPRAVALAADVWRPLPMATDSVGAVLSIFSPRNAAEFARVLHADGILVVVTPNPDHLGEIVGPMEMLAVGADKEDRLREGLRPEFEIVDEQSVSRRIGLTADAIADLVAMGPSAFHHDAGEINARARALTTPLDVTFSVTVSTFAPSAQPSAAR